MIARLKVLSNDCRGRDHLSFVGARDRCWQLSKDDEQMTKGGGDGVQHVVVMMRGPSSGRILLMRKKTGKPARLPISLLLATVNRPTTTSPRTTSTATPIDVLLMLGGVEVKIRGSAWQSVDSKQLAVPLIKVTRIVGHG